MNITVQANFSLFGGRMDDLQGGLGGGVDARVIIIFQYLSAKLFLAVANIFGLRTYW